MVSKNNRGNPYTYEVESKLKETNLKLEEEVLAERGTFVDRLVGLISSAYRLAAGSLDPRAALQKADEEVETKLKEKTLKLEHQLVEERTAWLKLLNWWKS
ncbi:hypothetical protein L2E82_27260 [Cichorium intybus]|uniref:Uncharacterized protein n=1 Tax=Cichorium intybus TaxID=13427 RepID=A0ACB9CSV7_CICIN|nr:hypothetical protein L2E82_27260 [Cichorium intybus]